MIKQIFYKNSFGYKSKLYHGSYIYNPKLTYLMRQIQAGKMMPLSLLITFTHEHKDLEKNRSLLYLVFYHVQILMLVMIQVTIHSS